MVVLHPTSGYSEIHFYFEIHCEIAEIHVLLTDRINNESQKLNLINEHALNREPVPLKDVTVGIQVSREFENLNEKLKMLVRPF